MGIEGKVTVASMTERWLLTDVFDVIDGPLTLFLIDEDNFPISNGPITPIL